MSDAHPDNPPPAAGKNKRNRQRVRAKNCVHCYTPSTRLTKCKIKPGGKWELVCDMCWPTVCDDNPHYVFGGTWEQGRVRTGSPSKPGE